MPSRQEEENKRNEQIEAAAANRLSEAIKFADVLDEAGAKSFGPSRTGELGKVTITTSAQHCFILSEALRFYVNSKVPLYNLHVDIEEHSRALIAEAGAAASETIEDLVMRFSWATTDLELLLEHFLGRPKASIEQLRAAHAARSMLMQPGKRSNIHVSDELRSIIRGPKQ